MKKGKQSFDHVNVKSKGSSSAFRSQVMTGYMSEDMHRKIRNLNKKR